MPEKETYDQKLTRILGQSDLLEQICSFMANGGCLLELGELWDVRYSDLAGWINKEKSRQDAYSYAGIMRNEWYKERVMLEFRKLATADIRKAYDDNGHLLRVNDMPAEIAAAIAQVEVYEEFDSDREHIGDTVKVKFWDKPKALEMIGKKLAMWVERHHVTGMKLEDIVAGSRREDEPGGTTGT